MLRDEREERREGAELGGEGKKESRRFWAQGVVLATHSNSFLQSLLSFSIGEEQKKRNARRRLHEML